jgi:preprotein translocase subunit SecG
MLTVLLTIVHVVVSVFLIMVVLLQTGKRADLAGAFGGGGSQTAFGTRGAATLLSKLTTAAAIGFMVTSMSLAILGSRAAKQTGSSVLPEDTPPAQTQQIPTPQPAELPTTDPAIPADAGDADGTSDEGLATSDDVNDPATDPGQPE